MEKFIKYTELFERQTIEFILAIDKIKNTIYSHDLKVYISVYILLLFGFQWNHIKVLSNASENPLYLNIVAMLLFFPITYLIIIFIRMLIFQFTPKFKKYSPETAKKLKELRKFHLKDKKAGVFGIVTRKTITKKLRLNKKYPPVSLAYEFKKLFKEADQKIINSFVYYSFDVADRNKKLKRKFNYLKTPEIKISKELYFEFYWVLHKMGRIENNLKEISEFIINIYGTDKKSPFYNMKVTTLQKFPSNYDLDKKYGDNPCLRTFFNKNRELI